MLAAGMVLLCGAAALAACRVETADARRIEGEILALADGQIVLKTDKGRQSFPVDEVVEVSFAEPEDAMAATGRRVVVTALDDCLVASDLQADGKRLRVRTTLLGVVEVPVEMVRRVYLPEAGQSPDDIDRRCRELKLPEAAGDRLIVARADKQLLAVDGVLEAIDAQTITFRWQDQSRKLARDGVRAIDLAAVSAHAPPRRGVLVARDGSTLQFTALRLDGAALTATSAAVGKREVELAKVAALRLRSDNTVNLADLKPAAVKEHGFFETTFPHRPNRSVAGGPLRLGGRTYRTGLGLHSYCELLYPLGKEYSTFVATVGIDDAVRPNGDAAISFLGDGRPLGQPMRLTGRGEPQTVRLDVKGVDAFLIRVDFGADELDFSDHVDVAGARLIK